MLKDFLIADLGPYEQAVGAALQELDRHRIVSRIWEKDHTVWRSDPTEIVDRLGWLAVAEDMQARIGSLRAFAESVRGAGFTDVVLLGMGGSSLGPEVLRLTFDTTTRRTARKPTPRLWVLDSVVNGAVRDVARSIQPARTLFILASKSGGTIEVLSLFAYFWKLTNSAKGNTGGSQFVAITDPGTSLGGLAHTHGFRTTFINPPDIGGRYSVLSYFGLVPAALLGLDLSTLLERAQEAARACRVPARSEMASGRAGTADQNPGAYLGTALGVLAKSGRDKVTLVASPKIASFGLWAEQLLAESTGKEGKGLIPVAGEPLGSPAVYGDDRLFVYLRLSGDANAVLDRGVQALSRAGHPIIRLTLRDRYDVAAQFFYWEFATAVAGHHLGIHPFDQPNVQESKANTSRILEDVRAGRKLPQTRTDRRAATAAVLDLLAEAEPGRYVAILAYLSPSAHVDAALRGLRRAILTHYRVATTAGYGPRYLHSTGQLHKGGPNSGLFLLMLEAMSPDLPVPGAHYSFGTLATAQAVGDLQSLQSHARKAVRIDLGRRALLDLRALASTLSRRQARRPTRPRRRR
jgi:glucose-6-phosphate isomerase